jgi:hypothetical protein
MARTFFAIAMMAAAVMLVAVPMVGHDASLFKVLSSMPKHIELPKAIDMSDRKHA